MQGSRIRFLRRCNLPPPTTTHSVADDKNNFVLRYEAENRVNRHTVFKKGKCIVSDGNKVR